MTAIYMTTSTWCNISTFTTLLVQYISQPANLHLTIHKSKNVFHAGKIRGIIPHQPIYIKKMDHGVSEVIYIILKFIIKFYYNLNQ